MKRFLREHPRLLPPLSLKGFGRLTGIRVLCPYYHAVSDEPLPHIRHLFEARGVKQFEADLDYLLATHVPIDAAALLRIATGLDRPKRNAFFLSFDDGFREFHDIAAPILLRKGVPAALFITTSLLGNRTLFRRHKASLLATALAERDITASLREEISLRFEQAGAGAGGTGSVLRLSMEYPDSPLLDELAHLLDVDFAAFLRDRRPYIGTDEAAALQRQGFALGAHSVDHPGYAALEEPERLRQTLESIGEIERLFAPPLKLFSFPFTDHGVPRRFFDTIFDPAAPSADLTFGCAGIKRDVTPRHIHRIPMEHGAATARGILSAEYTAYMLKAPLKRNTVRR